MSSAASPLHGNAQQKVMSREALLTQIAAAVDLTSTSFWLRQADAGAACIVLTLPRKRPRTEVV